MRRTISLCFSSTCIFLALAWCGTAAATGPLQLAFAGTQPGSWKDSGAATNNALPKQFGTWVDLYVDSGDSLSALFDRAGLRNGQWRKLLELDAASHALDNLQPGHHIRLRKTADGQLMALRMRLEPARTLIVERKNGRLVAAISRALPSQQQILVSGVIKSSLSAAVRDAGAPANVAQALAHIYTTRENLTEKVQPGDRFSLIYAATGPTATSAPVIAASITSGGRSYRIFRRLDAAGGGHYYDAQGHAYESGIERTPLDYTVVSSFFSTGRDNPVLDVVRHHTGVDLAAPRGTTVHAAADGTVTYVGWRSGYGRLVKMEHDAGYSTRYAHLSKFATGLNEGDHVSRGQTIGYVGASGLATGNHLHFEIRKNGVPHDPLTMPLPDGKPLSGAKLTAFSSRIQPLVARLSGVTTDTTITATAAMAGGCSETGAINAMLALAPDQVDADALGQIFCPGAG